MNPYTDIEITDKYIIREFNENIDPIELKWYRDLVDRTVTILEGSGWYFQKDNELPVELKEGVHIFINKLEWHRVIKGSTPLKIQIEEYFMQEDILEEGIEGRFEIIDKEIKCDI